MATFEDPAVGGIENGDLEADARVAHGVKIELARELDLGEIADAAEQAFRPG